MQFLLLCICVLPGVVLSNEPTVEWPEAYSASGRVILPYGDINEPFKAAVNGKDKKAMFDFYDGTAVVIYRADKGDHGTMYKIVPETVNFTYNQRTCFEIPGFKEAPVTIQGVLPDMSLYKFVEKRSLDGAAVMIFQSNFTEGNKDNFYQMIVSADDNTPIQLYFLGFDRLFGSHYDEYIVLYDEFSSKTPDDSSFSVPDGLKCKGFPGPGVTYPMSESIFFELVGAEPYSKEDTTVHIEAGFADFKDKYNRNYADQKMEAKRKHHYHHNIRYIQSKNRQPLSYKLAVNHLADMGDDEIKKMRGYRNTGFNSKHLYVPDVTDTPDFVDWWLQGAVTPVKDQGICGSCWSFGTTGTLEGSLFLKTKRLVSLSEQALVDCSWGQGNNGCDGGESERAYEWILLSGCIPRERNYGPYLMEDGRCHANTSTCGAKITKYYNTKSGDVKALRAAIAKQGPISVAIDASLKSFSFYSDGVYYDPKCGNSADDLDHQVLAVGYGTQDDKTYWLIKNSWSTHWGMTGYILMSDKDNNCGVATDASFATIA